jgi:hypothetical protein
MNDASFLNIDDFSLAKGGPFYRLLVRLRLMRPDLSPVYRRTVFLPLFTWAPLLAFSALQGMAFGGTLKVPFLYDFTVSVRFLLALPLLIVAEGVIDSRTIHVVRHFVRSGLVEDKNVPAFGSIVRQISKMRNSLLAEGVIAAVVVFGTAFLRYEFSGAESTWMFLVSPSGLTRTLAGWWYVFVSVPIFQFTLCRWVWRYLIWCWFLWRTSRLELQLIPTHPDRAAGLAFLGLAQAKFGIIVFGLSSIISSTMGEEILFGKASLAEYKLLILGYVVLILIIFLGPLLVFSLKLFGVKRQGLLEYGALANEYTRSFDRKWIRGKAPEGEALIGSADIQSLADLGNSFAIVREMRGVPFDPKMTIVPIVASAVIPLLPLALTVLPLEEIIKRIFSMLI